MFNGACETFPISPQALSTIGLQVYIRCMLVFNMINVSFWIKNINIFFAENCGRSGG